MITDLREGWQWSSFFFINCHGFKPVAIDKEKKRERTARPEVFHEGARPNSDCRFQIADYRL